MNKTLYACWSLIEYTITLNADGGNITKDTVTVHYGYNYSLPTLTKTGYTFLGWFNNKTEYKGGTYPLQSDLTLTASWQLTPYIITYHLDNGTNSNNNPETYTINDAVSLSNPTKTGYSFVGLYNDSELTDSITVIEQGSTENIDIYAKWTIETYTITYNLNSGENNLSNPNEYNVLSNITLLDATREGYSFSGWYTNSSLTTKI